MILSMAKRKNTTDHDIAAKSDNMLTWSSAMNDALLEALLRQQEMRNMIHHILIRISSQK